METHGTIDGTAVTWEILLAEARRVAEFSYSPYSNFKVGAAGVLQDGRIVTGTLVENGSYGVTLCAECSMTSANISGGRSLFVAMVIVGKGTMPIGGSVEAASEDELAPIIGPCGRCRQVMAEHSDENTVLLSNSGPKKLIGDVLPYYRDF